MTEHALGGECPAVPHARECPRAVYPLGGWEEHKKERAGGQGERDLRGYWTVISHPTPVAQVPAHPPFLGGESGGPGAKPSPLSQRLTPQCARESHHRCSPAPRREHVASSGNMPPAQHSFLLGTRSPQPAPSISQLALKPGFWKQKSLLAFISKWLPQCLAPQQPRCPGQGGGAHRVGCACGVQGCGRF